ncbi:MAG: LemA family protein [Armatimonadetes bacterium]|nr:LemA family protein [Armatimonadota bacterium]NOG38489.1 LemA family protein [Armatimonadota bacterium]GIK32104.1 MAG: membrane protein [Armatimonadota bacterium]
MIGGSGSLVVWGIAVVGGALLVALIVSYNGLVRLRQLAKSAWADVDVYLKRRAELVPNVVETVRAYAQHEKTVLEAVAEARARATALVGPTAQHAQAETQLGESLVRVVALAEAYPELKANKNFASLQTELAESERLIASARQYFNACVRDYNTKIESFPSNLVASLGNFESAEFFEVDLPSQRDAPDVTQVHSS